ncbi:putative O-antigen/teichoic acid transporter [Fictibacillus macauensis ZFHKF-1]|uniref:Putative O-antigen/teichoic acid transporter n=1 Tax=Fictibacillus macauensis ZFHKF-1 TaxID=1196324 RepID=I8UAN7_9BACL|nr:flippase [Fictibacillus macauensis]EIT83975.1 putative O-antigen/teichoic acid transporter [Fictibacillus macauensis ZFHKF-1]
MLNRIKKVTSNKLFVNGAWLYLLQFFNTILPLITLPYITRVLGSSQYGVFSFSLTVVTYIQVIVEYGFNLSGSRKVALTSQKSVHSKIFSTITISKVFLCAVSLVFLMILCITMGMEKNQLICVGVLFSLVVGSVFQQTWLFQGLQEMKYITIVNLISRSISVVLIFLLVKSSGDIYLYCSLYGLTFFLNGLFSVLFVKYKMSIKFVSVSFSEVYAELKEGWYTFTTSAMTKLFSTLGVIVLGITSSDHLVGVYSAMQKIPFLIVMLYSPVGQAMYPYMSSNFAIEISKGLDSVKKIIKIIIPTVSIIGVILVIFSNYIVNIIYGAEYIPYSYLLFPLTGWLIFSILNNLLGIQILVASGYQKEYSVAFQLSMISVFISNIVLGYYLGVYGVAFASLISEIVLTIALAFQLKKLKIKHLFAHRSSKVF